MMKHCKFAGYASLFNQPDSGGDIIMPGAFTDTLNKRGANGIRMLFQHDPAQPVGRWDSICQDRLGLFVTGQLSMDVQRSFELAGLMRDGAIDGLSIGFRTNIARRDRKSGYRKIYRLDLWEISLVTFPMLNRARITRTPSACPSPDGQGLRNASEILRCEARKFLSSTSGVTT